VTNVLHVIGDDANPGAGTLEVIPDPTGTLPSRELGGVMWVGTL